MAVRFTVYTWYEKGNRVQQSNFRRWNRRLKNNLEQYDVIVFYSDDNARNDSEKFRNLRFWRLHKNMDGAPTALLNEAIRYARSNILVYVSPEVMARNLDLYRLANRVREDYIMAWFDLKTGFYRKSGLPGGNPFFDKIRWIFTLGRIEMYLRQNHPFDFFKASFFGIQKEKLGKLLAGTSTYEREELFRNDQAARGYLNYFLFHLVRRNAMGTYNEGKTRSYDFGAEKIPLFYSYTNTFRLIRLMFKTHNFHYPLNIYRVLLPLMQVSQLAFFIFVWFSPWKSLSLLAFYMIVSGSLVADIFFRRRKYNPALFFLFFFSWLVS